MLAVGESGESAPRAYTRIRSLGEHLIYTSRSGPCRGAAFGRCVLNTSPFTKFPLKKYTNANHASAL